MREITADSNLVAYCGLYCGACRSYLKEKCPGCHENEKASWCKIRPCCVEHSYTTCADCTEYPDPKGCRMYNNFMARLFGFIFRSDRRACIYKIREMGIDDFSGFMAENKLQSMKRGATKTS